MKNLTCIILYLVCIINSTGVVREGQGYPCYQHDMMMMMMMTSGVTSVITNST